MTEGVRKETEMEGRREEKERGREGSLIVSEEKIRTRTGGENRRTSTGGRGLKLILT